MSEAPHSRTHHIGTALTIVYVAGVVLLAVAPELGLRLLAKEGAVEQASHAVLVVAILAYAVVALRSRRPLALSLCAFLAVVLLEELDWGAIYAAKDVSSAFQARTGDVNFHNRWGGHSYLLFVLPVPLYGLLPFYPARLREPLERALGPAAPDRDAAAALLAGAGLMLLGLAVMSQREQQLDELNELVVYLWFAGVAALAMFAPEPHDPGSAGH
ncbi:hypothetical protein PPSIR1_20724 [Plesiocystis pacifica SIR-1]|uniref:Uncharacterized protein n=1 Tax=Plesiocystis pacifica SIR-1 TaxID=391625 RepID=A6G2C1_9BACT|nr:hypothetical protein [Plesiocystis pacifica]EDM80090.1 hypothetical protein PPSIR1_20724 [Plesiocystis pacifica SIR-1]